MHICFLMPHHWSSSLGGAELQVRYFVEYIKRRSSHEISMICANTRVTHDAGVTVYQSRPCLPIRKYTLVADFPSVTRHLARLAPDVVYTRTCTPLVGFAAHYCRRHAKTLVYHIANASDVSPPRDGGRRALLKKMQRPIYEYGLRRARVIVAQADYQVQALMETYGLRATAVIPNFHPAPELRLSPGDEALVLWVANLKPSKRPELFIELARRFVGWRSVRFVMVGAIQDPAYKHLLEQNALPENLDYLGGQSIDEVNRLFGRARAFVNTSRTDGEGFPNTFIQAWLHSVPVLSLEIDPDSVLTRHAIGEFCHSDMRRLQDSLESLLMNEAQRGKMGQRARDFAVANFSERNCEALLRVIEAHVS